MSGHRGKPGRAQEVSADVSPGEIGEKGMRFSEGDQPAVPIEELAMAGFMALAPFEDAIEEGGRLLRVRGLDLPVKFGKLSLPLVSQGGGGLRVLIVREEIEGGGVAVFFAHEQQGKKGGQQNGGRGEL